MSRLDAESRRDAGMTALVIDLFGGLTSVWPGTRELDDAPAWPAPAPLLLDADAADLRLRPALRRVL